MESLTRIGTLRSLAEAVAIANTIDPAHLSGERRRRDLLDTIRRKQGGSKDPEEVAQLDALIRELDPLARKPN